MKTGAFHMASGCVRIPFFLISWRVFETPFFAAEFLISMLRNQMPQKRKPESFLFRGRTNRTKEFSNMRIHRRFLNFSNGFLDLITSHRCMKEERSSSFPLMEIKK